LRFVWEEEEETGFELRPPRVNQVAIPLQAAGKK
jgi:hypothetical protein